MKHVYTTALTRKDIRSFELTIMRHLDKMEFLKYLIIYASYFCFLRAVNVFKQSTPNSVLRLLASFCTKYGFFFFHMRITTDSKRLACAEAILKREQTKAVHVEVVTVISFVL